MRGASVMVAGETLMVECKSDDTELVGTWREIHVQRRTARLNCERSVP